MKLYIDDERQAPEGWRLCTTPESALFWIQSCYNSLLIDDRITHISLDHDLGYEHFNGADLMQGIYYIDKIMGYLERDVVITSHSANPDGRKNIERIIEEWKQMKNA